MLAVVLAGALAAQMGGFVYAGDAEALFVNEGIAEAGMSFASETEAEAAAQANTQTGTETEVTEDAGEEAPEIDLEIFDEEELEMPVTEEPDTEVFIEEEPETPMTEVSDTEAPDTEVFIESETEETDSAEAAALFASDEEAVFYAAAGETVAISTAEELKSFRDSVNGGSSYSGVTVTLTADINLNNEAWTPIGKIATPFSGTFDGGGHTISGLLVNSAEDCQGLFGYVDFGSSIQNLSVVGSVTGANHVGGIAGWTRGAIANCTFSGTVTGSVTAPGPTGPYAGGVAGWSSGTIQSCINKGEVKGTLVGGVVGWNSGTVTNCLNSGSVSGTYAGGIAVQSTGTVSNCFNTGTVSGSYSAVVARNDGGSITNCYYLNGTVSSGVGQGGGFAQGKSSEELASGEAAYLLQGTQGSLVWGQTISTDPYPVLTSDTGKKVVKVTFQMEDGSEERYLNAGKTLASSDFPGGDRPDAYYSWTDAAGNSFTSETIVTADITVQYKLFMDGEGTEESPYLIPDAQTLKTFRDYVNEGNNFAGKYVKLTADINLNNETWTPIGNYGNYNYDLHFDGSFDGGGYAISNLKVTSKYSNQGLFGCLKGGTIKNLSVFGSVYGYGGVGGIAGRNEGGSITDCSFSGSVTCSNASLAGGITGDNYGTIMNCRSEGQVTLSGSLASDAGGIAGKNEGNISGCENGAAVKGVYTNIGGIAGENGGIISDCTNRGTVNAGGQYSGGITGMNRENSAIAGCTNIGQVDGKDNAGGIAGRNSGSVEGSSNCGAVTVIRENAGGIVGLNVHSVANCANSGAVAGVWYVGGIVGSNERAMGTLGILFGSVSDSSNTGNVSVPGSSDGITRAGGIVGYLDSKCSVTNCYYLEGTAEQGIGINDNPKNAAAKTADAYGSGEVANLLQGTQESLVWGQTLGTDTYPVLTGEESKRVCKVTFVLPSEKQIVYVNSGGKVETLPAAPEENQGQKFIGWKFGDGNFFTADTVVSADMTVTAVYEEEETVSVELRWGSMSFTFADSKWNPEALAYENAGWTADEEGGGRITAENTGKTDVTLSYEYRQTDMAVSGSFADETGTAVTGMFSLPAGEKKETSLILDGKPSGADSAPFELGVVTVTIGGE